MELKSLKDKMPEELHELMKLITRFPNYDAAADITLFLPIPQTRWEHSEGLHMTTQQHYDLHMDLNSKLLSASRSAILQVFSTHLEEMEKLGLNLNYQLEVGHSSDVIKQSTPQLISYAEEKHLEEK